MVKALYKEKGEEKEKHKELIVKRLVKLFYLVNAALDIIRERSLKVAQKVRECFHCYEKVN